MAWLSPRSPHPPRSGVCPAANRNSGRQDTLRPPPPSSLCPGEGLCCFGRARTFCVLPDLNPFRFLEAARTNLPVLLVAAGRGKGALRPAFGWFRFGLRAGDAGLPSSSGSVSWRAMQGPVPWDGTAAITPPNLEMFLGLPGIDRPLQPVRTPQAGPGLNLVRLTGTRRLVATRRRDAVASEVHQEPSAKHSLYFWLHPPRW